MAVNILSESTQIAYKETLETKKAKSWLKSISAFANGVGGTLVFGVRDTDHHIVGVDNTQEVVTKISELIQARIKPQPQVEIQVSVLEGKQLVLVKVNSGQATPYYYVQDNTHTAFVRLGDETLTATEQQLTELILRGKNETFDSLISNYKKSDFSFTLFEATFRERTGTRIVATDYLSFGLVNEKQVLTNAGVLFTDQCPFRQNRVFCTRWNGLEKGSIFDDALDDKEFSGSLVFILNSAKEFIKSNTKIRWAKSADSRIEKPDYAERAYFEILVNAIIHRNYFDLGSEIHIDIYDNRLTIWPPGGMINGRVFEEQPIFRMESQRRNPIIADLFQRMKFMERRGSGFGKVIDATLSLPGYTDNFMPEFEADENGFRVTLWNVNYSTDQGTDQDTDQDNLNVAERRLLLIDFCKIPRSRLEMMEFLQLKHNQTFRDNYLKPLLEKGILKMTLPDKPNSMYQKYVVKEGAK
ncbi:MAG: AAA family ATPase [Porphyromonadaceae bacterium]|nr:AAA family ATPase [Porphyromonadaceae bacterium]